jgi:Cu(I)/Ag(I) efflux system membrane fusion protein
MDARPPITPLPQPRSRHTGPIAVALLASTTVLVWTSREDKQPAEDPRPAVASVPLPAREELAPIELEPGAATAVVAEREMLRVIVANGAVTFDASRTHHVDTPVAGLLVKPRASWLGRQVRAGETMGVVYSLEVYFATLDLLAQHREFTSQELLDRERMRLLRWGMRQEQVSQIERTKKPTAALPIIARKTGKVVAEQTGARQLIEASDDLMTITDPTYASVYVAVPAADAALLAVGQKARVRFANGPKPMTAPIGYIARAAEDGMKTVRVDLHPVRLAMPPNSEAMIELARKTVRGPAIPDNAAVREAGRTLVYVVRGTVGEPRVVRLGAASGGFVLVEEGVATGETVVLR